MSIETAPTKRAIRTGVVLVISRDLDLIRTCDLAAMKLRARAEPCEMAMATTAAARHRPFAIVVPEKLYAIDPPELDSLARSVGADIVQVPSGPLDERRWVPELETRFEAAHDKHRPR